MIAKKLGMDPIKLRQKNFMHDGDIDPTGEEYSYIKTDETLKKALEDSGYKDPRRKMSGAASRWCNGRRPAVPAPWRSRWMKRAWRRFPPPWPIKARALTQC